MKTSDRPAFAALITGMMAYHRQPMSDGVMLVWWNGCQRWSLEQVTKAINQLTQDPEAGKFPPKIGDITRVLEGTVGDRAQIAWGKTLDAMSSVGAYTDVVFDDPAIHAVVQDMGGWPKLCRTELRELGPVQHRFCAAHQAYTSKGRFDYPRALMGDRSTDGEFEKRGMLPPLPRLIGDPAQAQLVYDRGAHGKRPVIALARTASQLLESAL